VKRAKIGSAEMKVDDVGVWVEGILKTRTKYEKAIAKLAEQGKLSWSSGTAPHLVETKIVKGANRILTWPLGLDASLTPTPCESRNDAISIKSYAAQATALQMPEGDETEDETLPSNSLAAKLNQLIDDRVDDGHTRESIVDHLAREAGIEAKTISTYLDGTETPTDPRLKAFARVLDVSFDALKAYQRRDHLQTIKGMFEEALAEQTPSRWELESTYCRIIKKLANAASASQMAGVTFDLKAKVQEATDEYTALLAQHALSQIESWMESGASDDFYLKAIIDTEASVKALASSDLDNHSQLAVSALRDLTGRFRGAHNNRLKAGRVLSEKNRTRISELMGQLKSMMDEMKSLLDESMPKATDAEKRAAITETLRLKWRTRQLGVSQNG
jgi:transcriptional regulator with XRE-family HTH domain